MNTFKSWLIANIEVVLIFLTVLFMVFVTFYTINNYKQTLDDYYLSMLYGMAVISFGICSMIVYLAKTGLGAFFVLVFVLCIELLPIFSPSLSNKNNDSTKVTIQKPQIQGVQIQDFQSEAPLIERYEAEESPVEESLVEESQVEVAPVEESQVKESQIEESPVEEPKGEGSQVEESPEGDHQEETSQIEESPEGDSQKEVSQAEGSPVEEPKGEESQVEESTEGDHQEEASQAEESLVEESQIEEFPAEESQVEESQTEESPEEESQVDEFHIQEKESTEKTEWEFLHLERLRLRWFIGVAIIAFLFGLYCAIYAHRNFDDVVSRRFLYRNSDVSVFEVQWKYTFNRLFAGFITVFAFALEIMCFIVIKP